MSQPKWARVGNEEFASVDVVKARFRKILDGTPRESIEGRDRDLLLAVMEMHPDKEEKLEGQKLDHFEVRPYVFGNRSIFIVRSDGKAVDLSYQRALGLRP